MFPPHSSLQLADFRVFPKHVGVWSGDWTVLDATCQITQRFTAILTQRIVANEWRQTNEHTYADGRQDTQEFIGTIVGQGQVKIETNAPSFHNYTTLAEEYADQFIVFRLWDKSTGHLRAIELINLVSDTERVRTTQSLTPDGKLRGVMVITEHKIGH